MIDDDKRKTMRDSLDELDKYVEEVEKQVEEAIRDSLDRVQSHPFVSGFSFKLGPEGKPSFQLFGDKLFNEGEFRTPMSEQILDEKERTLKLVVDMPGVEKSDIKLDATVDSAVIVAERGSRKYKADVPLKADVQPGSGRAEFKNGVLEISFSLKDKTNKDFKRVDIV
jgi:HSP20 family protein